MFCTILGFIKGIFTVLNLLLFLLLAAFVAARFHRPLLMKRLIVTAIIFFLLTSTWYLPGFLASRLESKYQPLDVNIPRAIKGVKYVLFLGSGYGADDRLPPTAKMAPVAQGRMLEAIRVYRGIDSAMLVCSGSSIYAESQASVAKKAAILLGVDSTRILRLDDPTTTKQEATSLKRLLGTHINLVLVTDAAHMPRAMKIFMAEGFNPIPAPTNYKVLHSKESNQQVDWWPSTGNIILTDMLIHEYLANIKNSLQ